MREVFEAQNYEITDGDFLELVRKDANQIGLNFNENEIEKMKKEDFRKAVKIKI